MVDPGDHQSKYNLYDKNIALKHNSSCHDFKTSTEYQCITSKKSANILADFFLYTAARQLASDEHNREETPLFAKSIENKALTGKYSQPF